MKLRFKRTVVIEVGKLRWNEIWDKIFRKWDEIEVESINLNPGGETAHIITYEGDTLLDVSVDAYEVVKL